MGGDQICICLFEVSILLLEFEIEPYHHIGMSLAAKTCTLPLSRSREPCSNCLNRPHGSSTYDMAAVTRNISQEEKESRKAKVKAFSASLFEARMIARGIIERSRNTRSIKVPSTALGRPGT
jgi:hypothetical protein